jgi:hypothetical protein
MNIHDKHDDPDNLQPESSGIKARPVLTFLIVLGVATIIVFILIKGLLYAFDKMDAARKVQPSTALPEGLVRKLPPEPRLQGAPGTNDLPSLLPLDEMKAYRKMVDEKAESYGWVTKESGIAHIPISRAKDLIVERGLPTISGTLAEEIQKAEAARKRVLGAESNAGRRIKGQQ